MQEYPYINLLSIDTLSHLNVESKPRMMWCGDEEMEPMENLYLGNGMSALTIMKKSKNGCHFINMPTLPDIRQIHQKETLKKITDLSRD